MDLRLVDYRRRYPHAYAIEAHYLVELADGLDVGSILATVAPDPAYRWRWSIGVMPRTGAPPGGLCGSLEEAMAAFRAAWDATDLDLEAHRRELAAAEAAARAWGKKNGR